MMNDINNALLCAKALHQNTTKAEQENLIMFLESALKKMKETYKNDWIVFDRNTKEYLQFFDKDLDFVLDEIMSRKNSCISNYFICEKSIN